MPTRKFEVGDVAYGNLSEYSGWSGYKVVAIEARSYVFDFYGSYGRLKKVSCARADEQLLTVAENREREWNHRHRWKLAKLLESADVPTLRRVAEVLGFEPGEGT